MTARRRDPTTRRTVTALGAGERGYADSCPLEDSGAISEGKTTPDTSPVLLALSEREFQRHVRGCLELRGWTCWVVPNMKLTAAGLPDILAWHSRLPGLFLALELKRERDYRVTPKQQAALDHLETVAGIESRILRPSEWERLRESLDLMLRQALRQDAGDEGGYV